MDKKSKNKFPIKLILILASFGIMYFNAIIGLCALAILSAYTIYTNFYLFYSIKGNKAYSLQDYDTALLNYRKAITSKYASASIITGYVIIELRCGDIKTASEFIDKVLKERKFTGYDLVSLNVSKALTLYKSGQLLEAIELIKGLYDKDKSTYIYETLTSLLIINGQTNDALDLLVEALDYDDSSKIIRSNYGEVNFRLGNYDLAEEYLSPLVEDDVLFIEPYFYTALINKKKGNIEKAKELLEKSLETNDSILTTITTRDSEKELMKIAVGE